MKWNVAISFCCVLLLAANIALIRQNRQLKAQLSQPPPAFEAAAGTQMPGLHGSDPEGKPVEVLYGKDPRKVLVLVFSPTCPYCDQNWPKWQQVISSLDGSIVRPVAVDVTSTTSGAFVTQHQLAGMPVLLKVDPVDTVNYRFQLTPQTILVDQSGKVEKVWTGVLTDSALAELKQRTGESKTASQNSYHHPGPN
ncbi:MAG TPA: redoxin domain-containing protein [Candidatus Angelobacter sp.]|jgi:thiol-disulfide isomerase/thioredoxin|nr:redoxin domain-containing protein [Candidatus Angelobacter sp.]